MICSFARAQESTPTPPPLPAEPFVTFFPSPPPIYGAPPSAPSLSSVRLNGQLVQTPDELADFVGEIFYPMLGTRLFERSLGKKMEARLVAYATTRAGLLNELESELQRTQHAAADLRVLALQALAREQTPRVLALEKEAEQLRQDLARGGLLTSRVDWDFSRNWRLGDPALAAPSLQSESEFQAARAAAFFHGGLGIEQRGLLLEIAIDSAQKARVARRRTSGTDANLTAIFFSPETTRLHWPAKLPPTLLSKVGRYNGEKSALKRELLEALRDVDPQSDSKRTRRFTALTERQWPRIAELEQLAEEIRAEFAALPVAPLPWLPRIDLGLREQIERYSADRVRLIGELNSAVNAASLPFLRVADALFGLPPGQRERALRERVQRVADERAKATAEFQSRHAERIASLTQRYENIRADLTATARDITDPKTGQPITPDALLAAHNLANHYFEAIGREEAIYSRYKIAMLQPGLSPAQRRLLFVAAHAGLAQRLPGGEVTTSPSSRPVTRS